MASLRLFFEDFSKLGRVLTAIDELRRQGIRLEVLLRSSGKVAELELLFDIDNLERIVMTIQKAVGA